MFRHSIDNPYYLLIKADKVINSCTLQSWRGIKRVTTHAQIGEITDTSVDAVVKLLKRIAALESRLVALEAK